MVTIEEKKRMRFEFLQKLYEITDGRTDKIVDLKPISEELGLDKKVTDSIVQYLSDEYLLKWVAHGIIRIEHLGILEIEEALSNPDKPTDHFLPVNIIQADTIIGSIQQGGSGNIQITEYSEMDLQALSGIIDSILENINNFNLQIDDREQVEADLKTALAQAKSPKPKHTIIKTCLESVWEILKGVGTALAVQHADKLFSFLQ